MAMGKAKMAKKKMMRGGMSAKKKMMGGGMAKMAKKKMMRGGGKVLKAKSGADVKKLDMSSKDAFIKAAMLRSKNLTKAEAAAIYNAVKGMKN